ncbi:MAG: hypothetical protein ACJAWV_000390 [Flammeovirgaceae bacterium]|jgi:hypothetical protein
MRKFLLLLTALALLGFTNVFAQENSKLKEIADETDKKRKSTKSILISEKIPLTNNQPLYVVDGLVLSFPFLNMEIDPSEINKINVLKGAKANARYGILSKHGVIEIDTKEESYLGWKKIIKKSESFLETNPNPLIVLNGSIVEQKDKATILNLKKNKIKSVLMLTPKEGAERYGENGDRGVIVITAKNNE